MFELNQRQQVVQLYIARDGARWWNIVVIAFLAVAAVVDVVKVSVSVLVAVVAVEAVVVLVVVAYGAALVTAVGEDVSDLASVAMVKLRTA